MKVFRLVDWMDQLNLRVAHVDITLEELEDENRNYDYEKLLASKDTLVLELRTFDGNQPWIIGLELDSGKVVALPWWYFREVEP